MTEWNSESVTDWKICWFSRKPQQWLRPQVVVQRNNNEWGLHSTSVFTVLCFFRCLRLFLLKCVESMQPLLPVCFPPPNKKSICKLKSSTRCLWKWRASRRLCRQRTCTESRFLKSRQSKLFSAATYFQFWLRVWIISRLGFVKSDVRGLIITSSIESTASC